MNVEIVANVIGTGDEDPNLKKIGAMIEALDTVIPLMAQSTGLTVGDTICAVLAFVGKLADTTQNREPTADVMEKWVGTLRDPVAFISGALPKNHA